MSDSDDSTLKDGANSAEAEGGEAETSTNLKAEEIEETERDIFDLGLDTRNSFRQLRKNVRHFIAHEEYGVVFSFCGIRTTKKTIEYNPPARDTEMKCEKCKRAIWQQIASAAYTTKLKDKKDLI